MQNLRTKILGFALLLGGLALCGTGLWLLLSPAQFEATATIKLEADEPDVNGQVSYDPYFIQTEFVIIQSPLVLSNVVESLNLNVEWGKKNGDGSPLKTVKSIKLLQRQIKLEPIRNTKLLNISFSSDDPNEAARIANAIAKAYSDYRIERHKQLTLEGIQVFTEQYQQDVQNIKNKQENLVQLAMQLNLPNPEPTEELLKSNYPSYFQAKQELQKLIEFHKLLTARIEAEKIDLQIPRASMVEIVDTAKPPEFPVGPDRWLGAALLAIGLFPTVGGFLLLKTSRRL
jgi:uncharacterized protein involved in exopolysaccharide biosynthesis